MRALLYSTTVRRGTYVLALACACASAGCSEKKRPWQTAPDASGHDASSHAPSRPFLPSAKPGANVGASASPAGGTAADASAPGPDGEASLEAASPRGYSAIHKSCLEGFATSDAPRRDVERLGLVCGPIAGMSRLGDTLTGEVSPDGTVAASTTFAAKSGECYRVFAVGAGAVEDIDVVVRSSHKHRVAADDSDGPVAVVPEDRALCVVADDTLAVEVSATAGEGAFALQVYRLPAASARKRGR